MRALLPARRAASTYRVSASRDSLSYPAFESISYLLGAARALAFHPPSRAAAASPIARYLADGPLTL